MAVNVGPRCFLFPLPVFLRAGIKVPGDALRECVDRYHRAGISCTPTPWLTSARASAGLRTDTVSTLGADILEGRWTLIAQMHSVK